ncbi:MAG TPA: SDR family oxidoreductase, partial [Polyangiaceae bacterium]|nr:SDR family oxidoreductase [Polyangiaceae bacterium]
DAARGERLAHGAKLHRATHEAQARRLALEKAQEPRQTTTLITGANKGLGFETARRLRALGHTVYVGARDRERGEAAARRLGARFVQLDVTDDASVAAAAAWLGRQPGGLDVLVNNAGIAGGAAAPPDVMAGAVREVYETNVFGIVRVTQAMLPLLRASANPVIVNVSSGLGSFGAVHDAGRVESKVVALAYGSSKSAVTMLTVQYAKALPAMRVNAVDPGYTATDLNRHSGPQTVEQGTDAIVRLATVGPDGPTGTFQDAAGVMPW